MNAKELHIGCHVLAGGEYNGVKVMKHPIKVTAITETGVMSGNIEYGFDECEGMPISKELLLAKGFFESKLHEDRYIYVGKENNSRIVYNRYSNTLKCFGENSIDKSGVFFVHQLESSAVEANIEIEIM